MKYYYYRKNGSNKGPFTYEELKDEKLFKDTYVWTDGMQKWEKAHTLDELKDILVSEPPPFIADEVRAEPRGNQPPVFKIPEEHQDYIEESEQNKTDFSKLRYDPTYRREYGITVLGLLILAFNILVIMEPDIISSLKTENIIWINFAFRVVVAFHISSIAERQNRYITGWSIFAFLLPTLAMIIIGLLLKKIKKVELKGYPTMQQKVEYCMTQARRYYNRRRLIDSLVFLNKAIELDSSNEIVREMRSKVYSELNEV